MKKIPIMLSAFLILALLHPAQAKALSLPEALQRMSVVGHDIRISNKSQDAAKAQADMARAPLLPQVSAFAGETHYAYQPAALTGGQKIYTSEKTFASMGVDVYQTVFDFGATRLKYQSVKILSDRAKDEAGAVYNQAALHVITSYINVLEAQRLCHVAEHELITLAGHMREVSILVREGVATRADRLTVRVHFNQARQKLIVARSHEKIVIAGLKQLLSWDDREPLKVEDTSPLSLAPISIKEAVAAAFFFRQELRGLDKAVLAADKDEASLASSDKPSLFIRGGYNYADNRYQARDDNWQASVGVKLSVFNGRLTQASVAKAKADKERLIEERRKLEDKYKFDIEQAYWELNNASKRLTLNQTTLNQAKENVRVARVRYHEGAGTSVEFWDALVLRTTAETDLSAGIYDYQRAQAKFLFTMGKDLVKVYGQEAYHAHL